VVAPFSSGKHYRDEIIHRGWKCVVVVPAEGMLPPLYRGSPALAGYQQVVTHEGDLDMTAQSLRALKVTALVAGTEIGVALTEQLAHRLGVPGNDPRTSHLRRDKGAMAAALARAGLDGPRSLSTDRLQDALSWAQSLAGVPEFVLKPADSAGSDGVAFCSSPDDIEVAWRKLHQVPNAMGGTNSCLVLQERLRGSQYVVNSVSATPLPGATRHTITECWADRRTPDSHLYDRLDLLNRTRLVPRVLADYTVRVLDALGVANGPAHTEVMYVPGRGPVLIETGARPEGAYDPHAMREATGSDHIRDAVHAVVTGKPRRLAADRPRATVAKISLIAPYDGVLDPLLVKTLLNLPTVRGYVGALVPGGRVRRTVDLLTSPGRLTLAADDPRAIDHDHSAIRGMEDSGLYLGGLR
jgi:biotin carboxylase